MFSLPSVRIGKFFGIPVEINLSWLVIFALVAGTLSFVYFPALPSFRGQGPLAGIIAGLVATVLFFASILAHEFSHSLVAKALGIRIAKVTLFMFGGVSQMESEPDTPRDEFLMAIAGPAMSILLAAAFFLAYEALYVVGIPGIWWEPLAYLALINFLLGVFNLLPGFPLDGGRVLRSILWSISHDLLKATRWASLAGQALGWIFVALAGLRLVFGFGAPAFDTVNALWIGLLGAFLVSLAGASYRQQVMTTRLGAVTVDGLASRPAVVVPGDATVEQIVVRHILGGEHSKYPVAGGGNLLGILSLNDAKSVSREEWPFITAAQLAEGNLGDIVIKHSATLEEALHRLEADHPGMLVVERDGMLDGVLTRHDVLQALRRMSIEETGRS